MFLLADKTKCLCYGVYATEEEAERNRSGSPNVMIIFLADYSVNKIIEIANKKETPVVPNTLDRDLYIWSDMHLESDVTVNDCKLIIDYLASKVK